MRNINVNTYLHAYTPTLPTKGLATLDDQIVDLELVVESEMPNVRKRRINLIFTPFGTFNVTVYEMELVCGNIQSEKRS